MRKLIVVLLYLLILCAVTDALSCDWSQIQEAKGGYLYSADLHKCVGALVKADLLRQEEIVKLTEAISLQDLAIQKDSERIRLWKAQAFELEDKLLKKETFNKYENWSLFGLGVLATGLSVWVSGQVYK